MGEDRESKHVRSRSREENQQRRPEIAVPMSSFLLARDAQTRERNEPAVAHSRGNVGIFDICMSS
jgi:hypothetical protein